MLLTTVWARLSAALMLCGMWAGAQAPVAEHPHYSSKQLRELAQNAKTPPQIRALAE
jgi:hypothetical protein